jgi:ketosteroid isomerase-like protein
VSNCLSLLAALAASATLLLSAPVRADEAAVRNAIQAVVDAWNRHDPKAWSSHLAEDVWYTDIDDGLYQRYKGREAAVGRFSYGVESSDLQWEIVRMKTRPDGIVSVVLVERVSVLPKTDGKYKSVFTNDPSIARWRRDTDGQWRIVFFTSHKGWALAETKKDDEGVVAAAATTPAAGPVASRERVSVATEGEPKEYMAFWGRLAHGCNYCHGRPPGLPSSEIASRIVAVGAATADGAGLRAAMQRKELGGAMDWVLADPALDDAALEAVRRYLVAVRDGALREELTFDAPGAIRELQVRNERSSRDAAATIAVLRVSGPFAVDAARSTCRMGGMLEGQSACKLTVRADPAAAAGATGAVELQFAPTNGLEPRPRRTILKIAA